MTMETLATRKTIESTLETVRIASFKEKRSQEFEVFEVDDFLDRILILKASLQNKTKLMAEISEMLAQITWLDNLDDGCLMLMNDIISSLKDLHSTLIRQYVKLDVLRKKGLAKVEMKAFKTIIDDLREDFVDLEAVYFRLPDMKGFVETTTKLSLV